MLTMGPTWHIPTTGAPCAVKDAAALPSSPMTVTVPFACPTHTHPHISAMDVGSGRSTEAWDWSWPWAVKI